MATKLATHVAAKTAAKSPRTLTVVNAAQTPAPPPNPKLEARAKEVEERLIELYQEMRRDYIETGHLIAEVEDNNLWQYLQDADGRGYSSMDQWLRRALPYGRTTAYQARDVVRKFQNVPDNVLQEIPRVNLDVISRLPENKRVAPKWLRWATTLPNRELREKVIQSAPDALGAPTDESRVSFLFTDVGKKLLDRAFQKARAELGDEAATKEQCLAAILTHYLDGRLRIVSGATRTSPVKAAAKTPAKVASKTAAKKAA